MTMTASQSTQKGAISRDFLSAEQIEVELLDAYRDGVAMLETLEGDELSESLLTNQKKIIGLIDLLSTTREVMPA